jgi:hypothetical protein
MSIRLKHIFALAAILFFSNAQGQDILVTGRVVNSSFAPLQGVSVALSKYGLLSLTDSAGTFNLSGPAIDIDAATVPAVQPHIKSHTLVFNLVKQAPVSIKVFTVKGRCEGAFEIKTSMPGTYRFPLRSILKEPGKGFFLVRITVGNKTTFLHYASVMDHPPYSLKSFQPRDKLQPVLTKASAEGELDTVTFRLQGFIPKIISITSLQTDMGTIMLENEIAGSPVSIAFNSISPLQKFALSRLEQSLRSINRRPVAVDLASASGNEDIKVEITDAGSNPSIKAEGFQISLQNSSHVVNAVDETGAMYGLLDLAEQIYIMNGLENVPEKLVNPRFTFRAVKFNLPWSSYRTHEALSLHTETCRDPGYWERFIDMMAENRLNVLSLWNLHPWPYMIRPANFPNATSFSDVELEAWQNLWRSIFRMARQRGIRPYIVNWNIFVSQSFKESYDNGALADSDNFMGPGRTTDQVKQYNRECVTQVINEYQDLAGIGVAVGDGMQGMSAQASQEWIEDVYFRGMEQADRPVEFIQRAAFRGTGAGDITRTSVENSNLPGPVYMELKFNWSHALSSPKLIQVHGESEQGIGLEYYDPVPTNYQITWMIRNEDIFILRWGQPDFIRRHIELNGQDFVAGYYTGSETYIPATDYLHEAGHPHKTWDYAFERQWLYYMQWGRLWYNPAEPDGIFEAAFDRRYGSGIGSRLNQAYKLAGNMPLKLGCFFTFTWDFTLYSEGFLAPVLTGGLNDNVSPFISIEELMDHAPLDPTYLSITDYVNDVINGNTIAEADVTPLELADELENDGNAALQLVEGLPSGSPALECEILDVRAWSYLSLYFAEKLRAGVALQTYIVNGDQSQKAAAVALLENARTHWESIISVTKSHYPEMPLIHTGGQNFSWELYLDQVQRDIDVATGK